MSEERKRYPKRNYLRGKSIFSGRLEYFSPYYGFLKRQFGGFRFWGLGEAFYVMRYIDADVRKKAHELSKKYMTKCREAGCSYRIRECGFDNLDEEMLGIKGQEELIANLLFAVRGDARRYADYLMNFPKVPLTFKNNYCDNWLGWCYCDHCLRGYQSGELPEPRDMWGIVTARVREQWKTAFNSKQKELWDAHVIPEPQQQVAAASPSMQEESDSLVAEYLRTSQTISTSTTS